MTAFQLTTANATASTLAEQADTITINGAVTLVEVGSQKVLDFLLVGNPTLSHRHQLPSKVAFHELQLVQRSSTRMLIGNFSLMCGALLSALPRKLEPGCPHRRRWRSGSNSKSSEGPNRNCFGDNLRCKSAYLNAGLLLGLLAPNYCDCFCVTFSAIYGCKADNPDTRAVQQKDGRKW